jgi:drug/metabolite transporter (DMT)-like permease
MEVWIPITVAAAFLQNLRSALQKHLKAQLSTSGATFSRFCYAAPLSALYTAALAGIVGLEVPTPNPTFALYFVVGGGAQIAATGLLVHLFSFRNFVVGTTYSKTETLQTAVFGLLILGETVGPGATVAILVCLVGIMLLSVSRGQTSLRRLVVGWTERTALIGLG